MSAQPKSLLDHLDYLANNMGSAIYEDAETCAEAAGELRRLHELNAELLEALKQCCFALEPYDDIKPRDWKTDRERLRHAHQKASAAIAKAGEQA